MKTYPFEHIVEEATFGEVSTYIWYSNWLLGLMPAKVWKHVPKRFWGKPIKQAVEVGVYATTTIWERGRSAASTASDNDSGDKNPNAENLRTSDD